MRSVGNPSSPEFGEGGHTGSSVTAAVNAGVVGWGSRRHRRLAACSRPALAFAALLHLGGCIGTGQGVAIPVAVDASRAVAQANAFRREHGLGPLTGNPLLAQAATDGALAMARRDKMGHNVGGRLPRRVSGAGYAWGAAVENLGSGYPSLEAAMAAWEQSPGHRKNLLNPLVTELGIAAAATSRGSGQWVYWSLVMAAPREETAGTPVLGQ